MQCIFCEVGVEDVLEAIGLLWGASSPGWHGIKVDTLKVVQHFIVMPLRHLII